jgi:putative transposase
MKKSGFTDSQISKALKRVEAELVVPEIYCKRGVVSTGPFTSGALSSEGWIPSMMARLKELEVENARLKKMYAEERLKAEILNEALTKKW